MVGTLKLGARTKRRREQELWATAYTAAENVLVGAPALGLGGVMTVPMVLAPPWSRCGRDLGAEAASEDETHWEAVLRDRCPSGAREAGQGFGGVITTTGMARWVLVW